VTRTICGQEYFERIPERRKKKEKQKKSGKDSGTISPK